MHIILGATGHVGSAAADTLLDRGEPVTIVTHDPAKDAPWRARGAEVAVVDVHDSAALNAVFRAGTTAFLLNPPADVSIDTDVEEHATAASIAAALAGSGLSKVVVESTYGAQPGERCGDLNILYDFERAVQAQGIPADINRAAYYFSNWDAALETARDEGVVHTMLPADLKIPMVAPRDLGRAAADLLMREGTSGLHHVEGPELYSPADVAAAFADALGRPVRAAVTPRDEWEQAFRDMGFSPEAAQSYTRMTEVSMDEGFTTPDNPVRGSTTLRAYVEALVTL
jgi:uncharacterized protein YbjT (DUF2867 family)